MVNMTKEEKRKALVDAFLNEAYGTTFEHWKIAGIIGEQVGSPQYRQIVSSVKKELLDSGKMIASVHRVGYRIVNPDEYTDQSAKCVVSGARRIDKGTKILEHAPVKDMTMDGVQRYNAVSDRLRILKAAMCGAKVEIKMLNAKREHPLKAGL